MQFCIAPPMLRSITLLAHAFAVFMIVGDITEMRSASGLREGTK
jgi:hypothetical protein